MLKYLLILIGFILGGIGGYLLVHQTATSVSPVQKIIQTIAPRHEVIGFLPFWLLDKAQTDYSAYITTLSYFSLIISPDGTIQKYTKPTEGEPGYFALQTGKADDFLATARAKNVKLSLTVFAGSDKNIDSIIADPETSATNLMADVTPFMTKYGFTDLNLDVEQVGDASPEARLKFVHFVSEVKKRLTGTLTIDVTATSFVKDTNLSDPAAIAPYIDYMVIMAYDYHNQGSFVTGPVAPAYGAGTVSEFDVQTAILKATEVMPAGKIILGAPLYGYSWESLGNTPRSATIPATALTISSATAAELSGDFDETDQEVHAIYQDKVTGTYHQAFYPNVRSMQTKVSEARQYGLGGLALWALGYEDTTILQPLSAYRR